jgi:hypothetical protein
LKNAVTLMGCFMFARQDFYAIFAKKHLFLANFLYHFRVSLITLSFPFVFYHKLNEKSTDLR